MEKFSGRQLVEETKPLRKNNDPENQLVNKFIKWSKANGFFMLKIESKAKWNSELQTYTPDPSFPDGCSDTGGTDNLGRSLWVEWKAPKKATPSNLQDNQNLFLRERIKQNAFAGYFDSIEKFYETYLVWISLEAGVNRQDFLLSLLPPEPETDKSPLF